MYTLMYLYPTNPKRIIERFKMYMKGREQANVARRMMTNNPRPVFEMPLNPPKGK